MAELFNKLKFELKLHPRCLIEPLGASGRVLSLPQWKVTADTESQAT